MFNRSDLTSLDQLRHKYTIIVCNQHDVTFHSERTGHDWIIVSKYDTSTCYILHRHSQRAPYHRQQGEYRSFEEAMDYIEGHEIWFSAHKKGELARNQKQSRT